MHCGKCGAKNEDVSGVCAVCGAVIEETPSSENTEQKNSTTKTKTILSVAMIVLIIGGVCVFAKDLILKTFSPKTYVSSLIETTFSQVADELARANENFFGFSTENLKDYTVSLGASINSHPDFYIENIGLSAKIGVSESQKEAIGTLAFLHDDESLVSADLYLNDQELGVTVPELMNEYLVVPSKEFGKAWNLSALKEWSDADELDENLDISFSALRLAESNTISEETNKELVHLSEELYRQAQFVSKEKTEVSLDGELKQSVKYNITIGGTAVGDYLAACLQTITDDAIFKQGVAGEDFEESVEELLSLFDYIEFSDVRLCIYEYNNRIVKFSVKETLDIAGEDASFLFSMETRQEKSFINDVNVDLTTKSGGEIVKVVLQTDGNHSAEGDIFTDNTYMSIETPYEKIAEIETVTELNFKDKIACGEIAAFFEEGEVLYIDYYGTCSHDDGCYIDLDQVNVFTEKDEESERFSFGVSYGISDMNELQKRQDFAKAEIFNLSEAEFEDYFYSLSANLGIVAQKFYDLF